MDWCVTFPRENYLTYRPSLKKACGGNRNAAKFLSYLLFRSSVREEARIEARHINEVHKQQGLAADQDESITIYRTQKQIIDEMDEEISARTLRDESIPCLEELGYVRLQEFRGNKQYTAYTIYPALIQQGINHPEKVPHFKKMRYYLESEKNSTRKISRAEKFPNGSEKFPNGSEKFPNGEHEPLGKTSDPKSGNKIALEAASDGVHEDPRYRDNNKDRREEGSAPLSHSSTPSSLSSEEKVSTPETTTPTSAPASTPSELSPEEERIQGYWCRAGNLKRPSAKKHWATLSEHIQSFEQFESLFKYTQNAISDMPRPRVYPGNLVDHLEGWKQRQASNQSKAEGPKVMTALEKVKSYEETYSKAPPPVSPLELFKQKQKQARLAERKA